jgi:VWFA-related protein
MRKLALLVLLGTALSTLAQTPLVESIEVRVVNVDFVVNDKSGKAVTGLTRNDFDVFEDGKRQEVTNFYEVRGNAPGADPAGGTLPDPAQVSEARPRRFFLFVDASSLHPHTRDTLVGALHRFVDTQLQTHDQAAVIGWTEQIHVLSPLTSDKAALTAALDKVKTLASPTTVRNEFAVVQQYCMRMMEMARGGRLPMQSAYIDCISHANTEAAGTVMVSRRLLNALNLTLTMMGGGDAKKVLIVAGARLPKKPGADTFTWANSMFSAYMTGFNKPNERFQEDRPLADSVVELARNANSAAVTVYLINAPGISDPMSASNTIPVSDEGAAFLYAANTSEAFADIARMTGGASIVTRSNFDSLFVSVGRDLGSYYSIGYRPTVRTMAPRKIEVKPKNRAYTVRSRQTTTDKSADEQMSDRVIANVFSLKQQGDFPIRVATTPPVKDKDGGTLKITLQVVIPSSAITLLPTATTLEGGFTVWIAVGDLRGALSPVSRRPQVVSVPVAEEKAFRADPLVFTAELTVRQGESIISVAVVDRVSNSSSFGRVTVTAAP